MNNPSTGESLLDRIAQLDNIDPVTKVLYAAIRNVKTNAFTGQTSTLTPVRFRVREASSSTSSSSSSSITSSPFGAEDAALFSLLTSAQLSTQAKKFHEVQIFLLKKPAPPQAIPISEIDSTKPVDLTHSDDENDTCTLRIGFFTGIKVEKKMMVEMPSTTANAKNQSHGTWGPTHEVAKVTVRDDRQLFLYAKQQANARNMQQVMHNLSLFRVIQVPVGR